MTLPITITSFAIVDVVTQSIRFIEEHIEADTPHHDRAGVIGALCAAWDVLLTIEDKREALREIQRLKGAPCRRMIVLLFSARSSVSLSVLQAAPGVAALIPPTHS